RRARGAERKDAQRRQPPALSRRRTQRVGVIWPSDGRHFRLGSLRFAVVLRLPVLGVGRVDPALELGETRLHNGRRRCWAVFGEPDGSPVFWFHGTPGNRTQIPPATAREAALLGIKLVCIARPGVGRSSDTAYPCFAASAPDVMEVADDFGARRFSIVALSGGGPYAL